VCGWVGGGGKKICICIGKVCMQCVLVDGRMLCVCVTVVLVQCSEF